MKKFTKYFSVLLAVLLCCTAFFACEEEEPVVTTTAAATTTEAPNDEEPPKNYGDEITDTVTHETVFQKVSEQMGKLDSYGMQSAITMNMQMMGMTVTTSVNSDMLIDVAGKRGYGTATTQALGETMEMITYFDETVYYVESADQKAMADMTPELLEILMEESEEGTTELDADFFETYKLYTSDDGYILVISGLKEGNGLLDSLGDTLEGYEVDLSKVELEMQITKDFYCAEMSMKLEMTMNMDGMMEDSEMQLGDVTVGMEAVLTYSDYNTAAAKIQKPDMTGAQKVTTDDLLDLIG